MDQNWRRSKERSLENFLTKIPNRRVETPTLKAREKNRENRNLETLSQFLAFRLHLRQKIEATLTSIKARAVHRCVTAIDVARYPARVMHPSVDLHFNTGTMP